jgi:ubiquinone/menaquinone biosynthesis C-methylase UbiE
MGDESLAANLRPSAFAGTAEDYARYRPPYPEGLLERVLVAAPGRARMLDLACGPGRIALALAPEFEAVLAVDLEPDMVEVGQRRAAAAGITNVLWFVGRAEQLELPPESLDLITIGEAFHRLDQRRMLDLAGRWLRPGGVLATMGSANILRGAQAWHRRVFEVAEAWTRDAFPNGWASAAPGAENEPARLRALFENQGFVDIRDHEFPHEFTWTIESVLGYLRSMSVCSPSVLGERRTGFEEAVRSALLELDPEGEFPEELQFGLTTMHKPAN